MTIPTREIVFFLADATLKAALLLAFAATIALLSRRASASFRHLVWALGLGCALAIPLVGLALPHWQVVVRTPLARPALPARFTLPAPPIPPQRSAAIVKSAVATTPAVTPLPRTERPKTKTVKAVPLPYAVPPALTEAPRIHGTAWACLVWAAGVLSVLLRLALGIGRLDAAASASACLNEGPLVEAKTAAMGAMRVGRPITLLLASASARVHVPLTWGMRRPVVVLPAAAQAWPEDKLRAALLHEMAHVRRSDWLLQTLAHLACALYWFNPLVWYAARRLRAESETACDDLVLAAGVPATDYARHLLDVALGARDGRRIGAAAVAMAQTPQIERRLRAVLATGLSRKAVRGNVATAALILTVLLALPLAALKIGTHTPLVPIPDANRLQLKGDFTLRYAVTITDEDPPQAQFREYQQLRADYERELKKDPYFQPVPGEFYGPFSYFQNELPRTRHAIITVSARGGHLLWRKEEDGHTFALVYNGTDGTQLFSDGHAGRIETGLSFGDMSYCPLPGVGLPHIPLFKAAWLVSGTGALQTWRVLSPVDSAVAAPGKAVYLSQLAHMVSDGGTWKALDMDGTDQQFQFLQHQRFQGLWIASHMRLTKYALDPTLANIMPRHFAALQDYEDWFDARRRPTYSCDYRLLSASAAPLDLSATGMLAVSAAPPRPHNAPDTWGQELGDLDVQEALHLRYHLQDWAEANKELFQRMAHAPLSDQNAVRVAQSLRTLPFPLWNGDTRPGHVWDGDPRMKHDGQKPLFTTEHPDQKSLATARDFVLARSLNPGASHVVLWASGRITRVTAHGAAKEESQQEIVPAFFTDDGTNGMAADGPEAASSSTSSVKNAGTTAVNPSSAAAQSLLGSRLASQHHWSEAVPPLRRALEMLGSNGSVHAIRRIAANGNHSEVQDYDSLYALCDSLVRHGADKEAALRYVQALTAATGDIYAGTGQYDKALERYKKALGFDAFTAYILAAQSKSLMQAGRRAEARAAWKKIVAIDPPSTYYYDQAQAMLAKSVAKRVSAAPPQAPPTEANIAAAQEELRRVDAGYRSGISSSADVAAATIALAEARTHAALARNEISRLGPDLEAVATQRQKLLREAQARFQAGVADASAVNKAAAELAEAHVQTDLYAVLQARAAEFAQMSARYQSGIASTQERDKAAAEREDAKRAFLNSSHD